ncbi:MAG: branched chain amino acid aminotransferase [Chloroflexi bacterium]|nr:MAG: branched chain amino acid aminotransferase [Chloroflexota bacterium]
MPMTTTKYIWFNGELVEWERATVHVMAHALHYGSSIFEGIRAYATPQGPAIFRLAPHIERMSDSARIYRMELPYTNEQIAAACHEVVRANGLDSAYIRPIAYRGFGEISPAAKQTPVEVAVAAIPWGKFLGDDVLERGVDVCVSSWTRPAPNTLPTMAKAGGNYLSSQLIVMEAQLNGYVEGIALDSSGNLSEGSGENLFLIRNGVIMTPPLTASVLPGITRDTVITIARDLGLEVREQTIPREALYVADELFFTGTAAEVSPIRSVDGIVVKSGGRGPITAQIAERFFGLFNGETPDTYGWLDHVNSHA